MVEKGNCVSPFFWVRLYASYIYSTLFFYFSKTRRLENENRDCYFHTIYFCWKENLTFDTSIPDRMVSNWGDSPTMYDFAYFSLTVKLSFFSLLILNSDKRPLIMDFLAKNDFFAFFSILVHSKLVILALFGISNVQK